LAIPVNASPVSVYRLRTRRRRKGGSNADPRSRPWVMTLQGSRRERGQRVPDDIRPVMHCGLGVGSLVNLQSEPQTIGFNAHQQQPTEKRGDHRRVGVAERHALAARSKACPWLPPPSRARHRSGRALVRSPSRRMRWPEPSSRGARCCGGDEQGPGPAQRAGAPGPRIFVEVHELIFREPPDTWGHGELPCGQTGRRGFVVHLQESPQAAPPSLANLRMRMLLRVRSDALHEPIDRRLGR